MSAFQFRRSRISLAVLMSLCAGAHAQSQETAAAQTLPTVNVNASADASAGGLPSEYAGGQVARGARLGILGNVDQMNAPFSSTAYTQALIQDQQARSVADVLQNDPTVRVARGFGNYQELYMIRGFPVNSDDLAYNGLYGLLPRQFVATAPSTPASLVPQELLEKSDKILFIAHLAIGDYTYLQNCFKAFNQAYPHIAMHIWIDELRRTDDASAWPSLKKYALYDWVAESAYFSRVYRETYSPDLYERSVREAQAEHYPIVVSLSVVHHHSYVMLARRISADGFIVAQRKRGPLFNIRRHLVYRKLDAHIPAYTPGKVGQHISAIYAGWFERMFALSIPEDQRAPSMNIPKKWIDYADEQFAKWGFNAGNDENHPVIFLNSFAKSIDRSWPLERVFELIRAMRLQPAWRHAAFIINAVPEEFLRARDMLADQELDKVALFSANENFFQLPAIISKCTLVISVETGVMHLANAVQVPVLALMRQKNPEWAPFDVRRSTVIKVTDPDDWIDKITVEHVMSVLARMDKHD